MSIFHALLRSPKSGLSAATRRLLLLIGAQAAILSCARAACIDPATLVTTTVSIYRDFTAEERNRTPGIVGIAGTGWFLSPRLLVTAAHVAEAMPLSSTEWKDIEIWNGNAKTVVPSRIHSLVGPLSERMALLDLRVAVAGADSLAVRREPLLPEEEVVALAYPKRHLRFAGGRFVAYGSNDQFAGAALIEIYEGDDRLVLGHGASGAPVLDCQGRVVAVVSSILTRTLNFGFRSVIVSTAWQTPNVISMPADALIALSLPE
jgi:Trypsin-like peptidase domain